MPALQRIVPIEECPLGEWNPLPPFCLHVHATHYLSPQLQSPSSLSHNTHTHITQHTHTHTHITYSHHTTHTHTHPHHILTSHNTHPHHTPTSHNTHPHHTTHPPTSHNTPTHITQHTQTHPPITYSVEKRLSSCHVLKNPSTRPDEDSSTGRDNSCW